MKIRLRNIVAIDVSETDEQAVKLRFVTATDHEAVVVVPHELLRKFMDDLLSLSSEKEDLVANGKEPDFDDAMRGVLSKGVTRTA